MTDTKISTDNETRALIEAMQLVEDAGYVVLHPNSPALASRHQEPVNEPGEWQQAAIGRLIWAANTHPNPKKGALIREWAEELRAASLPKVERGVKIKPLEWDENGDAKTALATYHVEKGMFGWQWSCFSGAGGYAGAKPLGSKEEAKAAAQADYEQRIRSALKVSPSTSEGEAVPAMEGEVAMLFEGLRRNATPDNTLRLDRLQALYAAPQPTPVAPVPVTITDRPEVNSEREILERLTAGDEIAYSQDGDDAFFTKGDRAFVGPAIIDMRSKGYLKRIVLDPENYRGMSERDVISDAGRAALSQKPGEQG